METRNRIEYASLRGLIAVLRAMPAPAAERLMECLGRGAAGVLPRRRRIVREQLAAVYPDLTEPQVHRLAAEVFAHLGRTAGEVFGPGCADLLASAEIEPGWEPLDRALAAGRGAIGATGHIGNFELGGALLARRYRVLDVVKTQRNPIFDGYIQRQRHAAGIATVPMERSARAVLAHLRGGGLVTLLVDQDAGPAGETVEFLGRPAAAWTGAARIALRTGCPVVPLAIRRVAPGRHLLSLREAIAPPVRDPQREPEQVRQFTREISAAVEAFVREEPRQWFWVHRRWKSAGQGEAG